MIYALISTIITTVLTAIVALQYYERQRPYQLAWAISLVMAAVASLAYAGSIFLNGNSYLFRLYYWLGGQLMAAAMGFGSLLLVATKPTVRVLLIVVGLVAAVATFSLWTATIDLQELAALDGGSGRGIVQMNVVGRIATVILNVFGTVVVAGIAILSAFRFIKRQVSGLAVLGNVVIAAGVMTIGAAGSAAGAGRDQLFWPVMTLGWLIFFAGFSLVNRARGQSAGSGQLS